MSSYERTDLKMIETTFFMKIFYANDKSSIPKRLMGEKQDGLINQSV